jgi:hypothetical protein
MLLYCDTTSYNSLPDVRGGATSSRELYDVVSQYDEIVFGFQLYQQNFFVMYLWYVDKNYQS